MYETVVREATEWPQDLNKSRTKRWMDEPKIGMMFSEMYNFWMVVIHRLADGIVVMELSPPGALPDNGTVRVFETEDEFREHYSYGDIEGYWIRASKMTKVDGWYDYAIEHGNTIVRGSGPDEL